MQFWLWKCMWIMSINDALRVVDCCFLHTITPHQDVRGTASSSYQCIRNIEGVMNRHYQASGFISRQKQYTEAYHAIKTSLWHTWTCILFANRKFIKTSIRKANTRRYLSLWICQRTDRSTGQPAWLLLRNHCPPPSFGRPKCPPPISACRRAQCSPSPLSWSFLASVGFVEFIY